VLLFTSLSKLSNSEARGYEVGVLVLLMPLLIVICFKAYRKTQRQWSEAVPVRANIRAPSLFQFQKGNQIS
jgi:hypothetical protein